MRAFVAIKIPDSIKERIAKIEKELEGIQGVKWVKPDNIHLTLKFLGEVRESQIGELNLAIKSCIRGIKPFRISFSEIGGFPNLRHPKVIWVGVKEGMDILIELINRLEQEFSKLGFKPETREPSPHLTIGRIKKNKIVDAELKLRIFETSSFIADKVYLIKSTLTPDGPIYTDITAIQFGV